ncbi:MAG: nucleotidyl transferase AbiEii/AbiGii toxin family protein [Elusimicrobiota bacterium]|nr:nucleotidyl transferase AbiEii/AbiGii toxin family protein [Elusimicrobiota bacterium]
MKNTPLKTSIMARLSRLAKERNLPFQNILTDFLLERAAVRLTKDRKLFNHLIFKGGYVSLRVYSSPRYTIDLDAVIRGLERDVAVQKAKAAMSSNLPDEVWFQFEAVQELAAQNDYGGIRLVYRAGLGGQLADLKRAQIIHIDLGIGDPVTPSPRELKTATCIFEEPLSWKVYPLESIAAEKLHALFSHGSQNSRSKDVFDLQFLLPQADVGQLRQAIVNTFNYRGDIVPELLGVVLKGIDRATLRRGWRSAMRDFHAPPGFDEAFEAILTFLQAHGI